MDSDDDDGDELYKSMKKRADSHEKRIKQKEKRAKKAATKRSKAAPPSSSLPSNKSSKMERKDSHSNKTETKRTSSNGSKSKSNGNNNDDHEPEEATQELDNIDDSNQPSSKPTSSSSSRPSTPLAATTSPSTVKIDVNDVAFIQTPLSQTGIAIVVSLLSTSRRYLQWAEIVPASLGVLINCAEHSSLAQWLIFNYGWLSHCLHFSFRIFT
jgi:hypothetical protein